MFNWKRFFCQHDFEEVKILPCTWTDADGIIHETPVHLFICRKCGKRFSCKYPDTYYNPILLQTLKLWERNEYDWPSNHKVRNIRRIK